MRWIRLLKRSRVERVILAGSVTKASMYGRLRLLRLLPDWTSLRIWYLTLGDKRNDTVLSAVADELKRHGITMEECVRYSAEHLAREGMLTRRQPNASQLKDADFGWWIAKEMGRLDIGQSIAVKETEGLPGRRTPCRGFGRDCDRGGPPPGHGSLRQPAFTRGHSG